MESVVGAPRPHLELDLYRASRAEASSALARFTSDDEQDRRTASIAVGGAAEYLLACVVVTEDPVLLADPADVYSAVAMSRRTVTRPLDPRKFRSASWGRQVAIVEAMQPGLGIRDDMRFVIELRNAAMHAVLTSTRELNEAVGRMVRLADTLLPLVPQYTEADYWGSRLSVVIEMRDKRSTALRQRVAAKLAQARARFRARVTDLMLGDSAEAALLVALETAPIPGLLDDGAQEHAKCPACSRQGAVHYLKVRANEVVSEVNYDREGEPEDVYYYRPVIGMPVLFTCPVCELDLEADELDGFGHLAGEVDLDDEDAGIADYHGEPDEIVFRLR